MASDPQNSSAPDAHTLASQSTQQLDMKLMAALERLSQAQRVMLWERAKEHGLSPIQLQFLLYLREQAPAARRVSPLADTFDLTKATVSDAVSSLESKGYLERQTLPHDRRAATLSLTPAGEALSAAVQTWAQPLHSALQGLTSTTKGEMLEGLMQTLAALQRSGVITVARMCRSCRFFRPDTYSGAQPHYCALLEQPLALHDLRLDCPEHEPVAV